MDIEKEENFKKIKNKRIDHIFHFAAQAGVRYSAINPRKYINTNILGTINVLKFASKKLNQDQLLYLLQVQFMVILKFSCF